METVYSPNVYGDNNCYICRNLKIGEKYARFNEWPEDGQPFCVCKECMQKAIVAIDEFEDDE